MPRPARMGVMSLPAFHIYGLTMQLYVPFACVVPAALFPPRTITDMNDYPIVPTTNNIIEHACMTKCTILMCIPAFLEQWATSPDAVNLLKTFDLVVCFPLFGPPVRRSPSTGIRWWSVITESWKQTFRKRGAYRYRFRRNRVWYHHLNSIKRRYCRWQLVLASHR